MSRVHGVDVSYVQRGSIDWAKVKAAGFEFAWVKATEGNTGKDPAFRDLAKGALDAGLLVGAYSFARPSADDQDAARELENLYGACADMGLQLRPALDLESSKLTGTATYSWCETWIALAHKYWDDQMPVIYTGSYYWEALGGAARASEWAPLCPLWVPQYRYDNTKYPAQARTWVPGEADKPRVPRPWDRWSMWQFAGNGGPRPPGCKVDTDRNVYNGTLAEFRAEMVIHGPLRAA